MNSHKVCKERYVAQYTAAGFPLFPLQSAGPEPKAPTAEATSWQNMVLDSTLTHEDLPSGYGVCLGEDDFVIDVDPRRFDTPEDNQLVTLWHELELEPISTMMVETPGGGVHVYYKMPPGIKLKSSAQMKKEGWGAIEFKSKGQFVVGAGSRIHDKEAGWVEYILKQGAPIHIEQVPEALLKFAERDLVLPKTNGHVSNTIGTRQRFINYLVSVAPEAIEYSGGNSTTLQVAIEGMEYGLPEEATAELMLEYYNKPKCIPEWDHNELRKIVENAYKYSQNAIGVRHPAADFANAPVYVKDAMKQAMQSPVKYQFDTSQRKDGTWKHDSTINNVFGFFMLDELLGMEGKPNPLKGLLRFNSFSGDIEFTRPAPWHQKNDPHPKWVDIDTLHVKLLFNQVCNFIASTETINEGIQMVAHKNRVHPVRDYTMRIKWDGVKRIDTWLTRYVGAPDTPLNRAVGKTNLIAAIARAWQPGCKHDCVMVWEGDQGTFKSTAIEVLGGAHYLDPHLDLTNMKDATGVLQGGWIIELSEMDFQKNSDFKTLRAFISRKVDKVRPPYARYQQEFPRRCIFIGSFNPEPYTGYLTDPTGNRRFQPVKTGFIDLDALKRDRDQLWAEAMFCYQQGDPWWIEDKELKEQAQAEVAKRMTEDCFQDIIETFVHNQNKGGRYLTFSTTEICTEALGLAVHKINNVIRARVCRILQDMGFVQMRVSNDAGGRKRIWVDSSSLSV